jgi:outer membrane protein assembly factor BamB
MTAFDRDTLIRQAIAPDDRVNAPPSLGDDIYRTIVTTPQRRRWLAVPRLAWPVHPSPAFLILFLTMLLLLLFGSLIVLSRPPAPRLAMHHGGPDRTGVMPGPGPVGEPIVDWEVSRSGAITVAMTALVADGLVFVADDSGTIGALDERTGIVEWSRNVGSPVRSSPVLVGRLVVVGSIGGTVVAFDTIDGSETWRFAASGPVSASLAVVDDTVYAGSEAGILHALDGISGDERWSMPVGGPITSGPAIADGVIYVGATGGRFSAIDARSQEVKWRVELGAGGVTTPAVANGTVYVGRGFDAFEPPHDLVALDVVDGDERWVFASPLGRQVYAGAVAEDFVYAVSDDNSVYALDPANRRVIWTHATDGTVGGTSSGAGLHHGARAGLVDDTLYVSSTDWTVRALDATSGAPRWVVDVEGEPSVPAVINGRLLVGTTRGNVYAIGGTEEPR